MYGPSTNGLRPGRDCRGPPVARSVPPLSDSLPVCPSLSAAVHTTHSDTVPLYCAGVPFIVPVAGRAANQRSSGSPCLPCLQRKRGRGRESAILRSVPCDLPLPPCFHCFF